jgi:hypothetical protein
VVLRYWPNHFFPKVKKKKDVQAMPTFLKKQETFEAQVINLIVFYKLS